MGIQVSGYPGPPSSKVPRKQKEQEEHAKEVLADLVWKKHTLTLTFLLRDLTHLQKKTGKCSLAVCP